MNKIMFLLVSGLLAMAPGTSILAMNGSHLDTTTMMQNQTKTDEELTNVIEKAFSDDQDLSDFADDVDVSTKDGVVTLTGTVDSITTKAHFETITKAVAGVKQVINNIEVEE